MHMVSHISLLLTTDIILSKSGIVAPDAKSSRIILTGTFSWPSGLSSAFDIQYVPYLGTNDKDTDEPVYTPEESLKILEEILLRHFGGYTIQEARGGWVDNETEYQEYTLVIYLSDTNLDAVRAAADEMIETFRQSSVLIQANPTRTEFYSAD